MPRPFRYTFILGLVAVGTVLAAVGGWRYARASAPVSGPIILISIDTLRADHLPVYGYDDVRTPAIDALAADGIVFERAYSHAPQTLPAHVSLLTGRLPFETGVRDNAGFVARNAERLVPEILSDRGYATAAVVSSYVLRRETGIGQGFAFFDADMGPRAANEPVGPVKRDGAASELLAEKWMASAGTSRAFLFLHLYEPHKPYAAPARFAGYAPYDAEIAYADEIVGRFVKYLKTHQLYDQSTIILLSDHGEGLGDHGEQEHGLFVYDEAVRVPLIVKQAAGEGAGRRVTDPVQHIDLAPTILDLAKAPVPGHLRGRSLKPLLDGTGRLADRTIYGESMFARYRFGWSGLTSITDGRYRYIKAPREELYDLRHDPKERDNVAARAVETSNTLRRALDRVVSKAPIPDPSNVSADEHERLEALGYVGTVSGPAPDADANLPDPKDKSSVLEKYREAIDRVVSHHWSQAIELLQTTLRGEPAVADLWSEIGAIASRSGRYDQALDAYRHAVALEPADPNGYLGVATALLRLRRLEEASEQAALAVKIAPESDSRSHAAGHELLMRIALARHQPAAARVEAQLAQQAQPDLPLPAFADGRLLYDEEQYEEAMTQFEAAATELQKSGGRPISDLHFYSGDALVHLYRYVEAEHQFLEELRQFPHNIRARAALATLYYAMNRAEEASEVLADLIRVTPTPEAYGLSARLWSSFGFPQEAAAVREEARRAFATPRAPRADQQ